MSELSTSNTGLQIPEVKTPYGLVDPNTLQSSSPSLLSTSSSPVATDASGGLGGISGNVNYTGTAPRVLDSDLTITNIAQLTGARVLIDNFDASRDRLGIDGATSGSEGGVTWNYDSARGFLVLDSTAVDSAVYQGLLRRVTYANTDPNNPGATRNISFSLGNLLVNPENGHFYDFVTGGNNIGISWTDARAATANQNYLGRQGYLATITTQTEQNFIQSRVTGNGWIGASDAAVAGDWRWVTGPEGLEDGGAGRLYWRGLGADFNNSGANGAGAIGGFYNNWDLQRGEPNNSTDAGKPNGEQYAHIVGNADAGNVGKWNDLPNQQDYTNFAAYRPQGYIVEYGGLSTDTSPAISASITLSFGGTVGSNNAAVGTTTKVPNFGGSNIPQLLWRNYGQGAASGQNVIWTLNYDGTNTPNAFTFNPDSRLSKLIQEVKSQEWDIVGLYDADGDGITDIFWRNRTTGENALWMMKFDPNTGIEIDGNKSSFLAPVPDTNWEIKGVLDFDNNNAPDILWHNRRTGQTLIWAYDRDVNNTTTNPFTINTARTRYMTPLVSSDWDIEGWADFNSDRVADILWRNSRTGENYIWKLSTDASGDNPYFKNPATDGYAITRVDNPDWQIADLVDFNNDGVADIIWRNYRTGENTVWGMLSGGDADPTKSGAILQVNDVNWRLEGTADFTGDGLSDLLWRNYSTGENIIWGMSVVDGKYAASQAFTLLRVEDPNWEIEGPNPTRDIV